MQWHKLRPPEKKRPVEILTRNWALESLGEVTVAPVTSTIRDIPTEVVLGPSEGMPKECAGRGVGSALDT